jgi:asparagine synthase (glutamine-hydrolysing)
MAKKRGGMCGITGYVNWQGVPDDGVEVIKQMAQTLAKRGPDGHGVWVGSHAAFGHRRLSIIDIAGGAQPMAVKGQGGDVLVIAYNGELFNYRELRHRLVAAGHDFISDSDTEVVLRAYDEWGEDCVREFTGMFAFAIWDTQRHQLFMARDPLGVKPLYYYQTVHGIVFGSEEKSLFAHPDVSPELDTTGLAELFCMPPMTNPDGAIFYGMTQVRPGYTVTFREHGAAKRCYWKLEAVPHTDDEATTVRRLRELFETSVRSQLVSDVPLGAILSGGIDSSAVAAVSAKLLHKENRRLPTFDIDYDSTETSYAASALHVDRDNPWAIKVAKHISSKHSTHFVSVKDLLAAQADTLTAWGRPMYSPINVSLYLLFKYIRQQGIHTVLGGEGADEALAGYRWWRDIEDVEYDGFPWHRTYREASYLLQPGVRKRINPKQYIRESYQKIVAEIPHLPGESKLERRTRNISWLVYMYYLNFLLHRVDRMSMAASVEARVPFCDHNFVQYAWNIPWEMKNTGGMEKGIFRRAIEDLLPRDVVWRKKSGYPVAQMKDYQQALWDAVRKLLASPSEPIWDVVGKEAVKNLIDEQEGNIAEWTWLNHISYVLEMNTWFKQFNVRLR